MVAINFETLFEILRLEKRREDLQELPLTFYDDVKEYIHEKEKILQIAKTNQFSEEEILKTEKQLSNIYKILDELYNRRESKIVNLAMIKSKTDSSPHFPLSKEELILFNKLKAILVETKKSTLGKFLDDKKEKIETNKSNEDKTLKIKLISDVPKFVGKGMQIYGPYQKEQIVEFPKSIANLLIKKNLAVKEDKSS